MNNKIIDEKQLRTKLRQLGMKKNEIENFINKYLDAGQVTRFNSEEVSKILKKKEAESILRVGAFTLTPDQYSALLNYFEESGNPLPKKDAKSLVQKAIKELINMIS